MSFIADIRISQGENFRRIGKIWSNGMVDRIWLTGFAFCSWSRRPYMSVENPPHIDGDIWAEIPTFTRQGTQERMTRQWVGHIHSTDSERPFYHGELVVLPLKPLRDYEGTRLLGGIWLKIGDFNDAEG